MNLSVGLSSKNAFVRKGTAAVLCVPRAVAKWSSSEDHFRHRPPVLANSFPKSGTHLLNQIVGGISGLKNYGLFLSSMTSSFQFRDRTQQNMLDCLSGIVPGEIVRGHAYYDAEYSVVLARKCCAHYFIYRDPRDVVVSEAKYFARMNRWHRLHPHFRTLNDEEAILRSIVGFHQPSQLTYDNVNDRFAKYRGWIDDSNAMAVKFEDLVSQRRDEVVLKMAEYYGSKHQDQCSVQALANSMIASIDPTKSHTVRVGKSGGWRTEFTARCKDAFKDVCGDLLVELGYEQDHDW